MQDCQNVRVSNKMLYPNFARTNPQHEKALLKVLSLVKAKGLKRVNIIYEDTHEWLGLKERLVRLLKRRNVKIVSSNKIGIATFHFGIPDFLYTLPSESQGKI
jgi:hypothetical protein